MFKNLFFKSTVKIYTVHLIRNDKRTQILFSSHSIDVTCDDITNLRLTAIDRWFFIFFSECLDFAYE